MKVLITGAKGQLAGEFAKTLKTSDFEAAALNKEQLDISSFVSVMDAVSQYAPDVILNCAAYNLVDKAEENYDAAFSVNAIGVKNLAVACKKNNALLVHYSTDYIFDGRKEGFYSEADIPNPINKYGMSKLSGERMLMEETDNFLIFRVSWVFGEGRQNFLHKLSELADRSNILKIVCDQISVPTYTADIVRFTMLALNKGLRGIYHLTNSGYAARYEIARYFIDRIGSDNLILPVTSDYFPSAAKRPYFSAMSNAKLSKALGVEIPQWKDAIDRFVDNTEGR
ncbi:MAG: dTDP-4-dehydrorhamnose reductase [Thermodesulfovibrionales bacterium]|nr:dTDP-4-dehydrorhamnose reductase [Thermodesulfovibrionales bacterium]